MHHKCDQSDPFAVLFNTESSHLIHPTLAHIMTPEGNTLYFLLKRLQPPTLEVHMQSRPGISQHSRGKKQSLCIFKVTLPKT